MENTVESLTSHVIELARLNLLENSEDVEWQDTEMVQKEDVVTTLQFAKEKVTVQQEEEETANLLVLLLQKEELVHVNGIHFPNLHSKENVVVNVEDVLESNAKHTLLNANLLVKSSVENGSKIVEQQNTDVMEQEKDVVLLKNIVKERSAKF